MSEEEFYAAISDIFHSKWRLNAACFGSDPDIFQCEDRYAEAKKICDRCSVRVECLDNSLNFNDGMFRSGLSEKERNSVEMHRKRHLAAYRYDLTLQ